jgi:hypothetical protein
MRTRVTLQLLEEIERFGLRYTCDDCAHFHEERCAHGYPEGERRRTLTVDEHIEFCKEFDAG